MLPTLSLGLAAALALGGPRPLPAQTAITGVSVVDVRTGTIRTNQTIVISGDTLTAVGAANATPVPRGATRIDGRGKFAIPGLWDMHVHLSMAGRGVFGALIANGVTGVRDMGGDPIVLKWRDSINAGTLAGPRIKAAGIIVESARWLTAVLNLTRPLNRPQLVRELERRFGIDTPEDAEHAVDSLVRLGADFVKIRNYPAPAAYFALARAAKRHNLTIAGHGPPLSLLPSVSDSGFASLEHSLISAGNRGLVEALSNMPANERTDLFQRLSRNGTAWDPTFVSGASRSTPDSTIARMIADTSGRDPKLRYLTPELREQWKSGLALRSADPDTTTDWVAIHRASLTQAKPMHDAGVVILAGTDLPVLGLLPGLSLHDELEILVRESGLTPIDALRAATLHAARAVGLGDKGGSLETGRFADLVLLDANPLANISATRRIAVVVARGRVFDRNSLDALAADPQHRLPTR